MGRKHIYDPDWWYDTFRYRVEWYVRESYRKVEVRGKENIPTDGTIIYAGNHCNTLLDALNVVATIKGGIIFGTRADVFNNRFVAKCLSFLRMVPMVRQRDGLRNVLKNNETQELLLDVLEHRMPFCLFPEGRHRPAPSLLPLAKGAFRLALAANEKFGDKFPVYFVPIGLDYGDYFRYRSTVLINIGKPINVTEFIRNSDAANEAQLIDSLKKTLAKELSQLFTYIEDCEQLDEKWTLTKILAIDKSLQYGNFGSSLYKGMQANREIIADIENVCKQEPEEMQELLEKVGKFDKIRRKKGISIYSFSRKNNITRVVGKCLAALVGAPYWIYSAILTLPIWLTFSIVRKGIKDRAFHNTICFAIKFVIAPLLFLTYTILAFCLSSSVLLAIIATILNVFMFGYFFDYNEGLRRLISDIKIRDEKKLKDFYKEIVKEFNKLNK